MNIYAGKQNKRALWTGNKVLRGSNLTEFLLSSVGLRRGGFFGVEGLSRSTLS